MNVVYHYTSFESFKKIIQSKSVWLTDSIYQNDNDNSRTFTRLLCDRIKKSGLPSNIKSKTINFFELASEAQSYYIWSATFKKDHLHLWKEYGDGHQGIALGIDVAKLSINQNDRKLQADMFSPNRADFFNKFYKPLEALQIEEYIANVKELCVTYRLFQIRSTDQLAVFIGQYIYIKYLNEYMLKPGVIFAPVQYIAENCEITQHLCDMFCAVCEHLTENEIDYFMSDYQSKCINILNLFSKDKFWAPEEEARLVIYGLRSPSKLFLMANNHASFEAHHKISQYTDGIKAFKEYIACVFTADLITEVVIGSHFSEQNKLELQNILTPNEYRHIQLSNSAGRRLIRSVGTLAAHLPVKNSNNQPKPATEIENATI